MLTCERLREVLDLDVESGVFRWRRRDRSEFLDDRLHKAWNARCEGQLAGRSREDGYVRLGVDGVRYLAHRLIWFWVHGNWPQVIDHIDGNPSNNGILNLRSVSATRQPQKRENFEKEHVRRHWRLLGSKCREVACPNSKRHNDQEYRSVRDNRGSDSRSQGERG